MTREQLKALTFIGAHINQHGYSPNLEEIAAGIGLQSKSGAHRLVTALIRAGHLVATAGRSRAIALARPPSPMATQLAKRLTEALTSIHGFDDEDGVVIAADPAEVEATLLAALSQ